MWLRGVVLAAGSTTESFTLATIFSHCIVSGPRSIQHLLGTTSCGRLPPLESSSLTLKRHQYLTEDYIQTMPGATNNTSNFSSQWILPINSLRYTPSQTTSDMPLEKELYDRARGVEFLFRMGVALQL